MGAYGKGHKLLHWLLALNIGATLIFSAGMANLSDAQKEIEYGDHAFSVTTIFILMFMRTVWRLKNTPPGLPGSMPANHKIAAKLMHLSLYVLIFLQIGIGMFQAFHLSEFPEGRRQLCVCGCKLRVQLDRSLK